MDQADLAWISDFEKAVVLASHRSGLLKAARAGKSLDELVRETGIETRVLSAVLPVLRNSGALTDLAEPEIPTNLARVDRVLELFKGGTAFLMGTSRSFSEMWESGEMDAESARSFSEAMYRLSHRSATIHCSRGPFSGLATLVDLGGGGGAWASQAVQTHPDLRPTVMDLPLVCRATQEILAREAPQSAARIQYQPGNFFKDALPEASAYLLSNILHDWPPETCRRLLSRIRQGVPPGTRLYLQESLLSESKDGPRFTCLFHLLMLLNHGSQQFTMRELSAILVDSGFSVPQEVSRAAHSSLLCSVAVV